MLSNQETVRFGLYTADLRAAQLKKGLDTVPLQNLPFRILALLLREPGRVVTREELRQELWPADTFVDFERGISTAVSKLRDALGDSATNPRFIETVGRRGYRFIAPVGAVAVEPPAPATAGNAASAAAPARGFEKKPTENEPRPQAPAISGLRRGVFFALAIVVIATVVLAFDWIVRTPPPKVVRMSQLSHSGKAEYYGGLHTDGSRVYFSERVGINWSVMQTSLAGGEVVPVAMPFPDAIIFAVSPDHSEMLVTAKSASYLGKHALWIMPVQGGTAKRVGDIMVDRAEWFPDGQRLLCALGHEVFSVERDGTNRRHLFDAAGEAIRFSWKPDGTSFRFSVVHADDTVTLWEASAAGTDVHPLLPGWNDPPNECCGSWSADGKNFVFRSNQKGQEDLWLMREPSGWLRARKPKPVRLTNGPTSFSEPLISPDGKRIFALGLQANGYVARFDEQQRNFVPFPLPPGAFDVAFSLDGKWMAYIAAPGNTLWRSRIDGSDRLQLTSPPIRALRPRWSHDNKQILFLSQPPKKYSTAHIVSADGGTPQPVLENDSSYNDYADWSPDGESVTVGKEPEFDADAGISVVNLKTHQVSELPGSKGMHLGRWFPKGEFLVATSADAKTIFMFDNHSQKWKQVATVNQLYRFERDKDSMYYQDIRDPGQAVFRLDPRTGKSERVLDFTSLLRAGAIRCAFQGRAPDGSFVVSVSSSWADLYAFDVELPQ